MLCKDLIKQLFILILGNCYKVIKYLYVYSDRNFFNHFIVIDIIYDKPGKYKKSYVPRIIL
ncbi:hypothetical protein H1P_3890002 [Hyella patelloides LEGE 07179]|uniref:Uncharacterized protein n=1 Tax=Hyella patelloides LEGE 07179 TaxID=945734 RepID=A0A563VWV5_9CYAN|nr:hypothetical protein H1P_3890002 [Hyella patelloides LEGE 07179]